MKTKAQHEAAAQEAETRAQEHRRKAEEAKAKRAETGGNSPWADKQARLAHARLDLAVRDETTKAAFAEQEARAHRRDAEQAAQPEPATEAQQAPATKTQQKETGDKTMKTKQTKQTKTDRKAALAALAAYEPWSEAKLGRTSNEDLQFLLELLTARRGLDVRTSGMARTLDKYKPGYKPTIAASGAKSQNNGDSVADLLAGLTPEDVMAAAEKLLGLEPGELVSKYEKLNPGQKRMNSGNRIRAAIKRGDLEVDQVAAAILGK